MKIKKDIIKIFLGSFTVVLPVVSNSAFSLSGGTFRSLILEIVRVFDSLLIAMFTTATIIFFWGVSKVILNTSSATEARNGRKYMVGGIIAIFCLVSLWGIISFIQAQFGFNAITSPDNILLKQ